MLIFLVLPIFGLNTMLAQNKKITSVAAKTPKDTVDAPNVATEDPMDAAGWKRQKKNGKAEFSDTTLKNERTVTYDATGNMTISENRDDSQDVKAYPPSIADYYTQKYPNEIFRVLWTKDKIGNKIYYIKRKSDVFWFDQDGKFTSTNKSNTRINSKK